VHALLRRTGLNLLGQLTADLTPHRLDFAYARLAGGNGAYEPTAEVCVRAGRIAARAGLRVNRPDVSWAATGAAFAVTDDQLGVAEALEVGADAVGVQSEVLGELFRACRPLELTEQPEEPSSARLCERVVAHSGIHGWKFRTRRVGKSNSD